MISKLATIHHDFKKILESLSIISERLGFKIYLVGGVVRDLLLAKEIIDLDLVVEGDAIKLASEFARVAHKELRRHHAFGTATVYYGAHKIDFATARKETYASQAVLPRVTPAALRDDLLRRDFTINAMAISLNREDYGLRIDFYGGQHDLKKGLIRVLHANSFRDDPTRIIRAVRFMNRFGFRIEPRTRVLAARARQEHALALVHPHRLRDEIVLLLKEPDPWKCLVSIEKMYGLSFIANVRLTQESRKLFGRIRQALGVYQKNFSQHRPLDIWLLYLSAVLMRPSVRAVDMFFSTFDFRRGERVRVLSIKKYITKVKILARPVTTHRIYRLLNPLSFEAIVFLYSFHTNARLRANIRYFLNSLAHVRLKVRGEDLKRIGIKPHTAYGGLLEKLLDVVLDQGLATKEEEIRALCVLARRRGLVAPAAHK
ncbi:MAG: hypothetical protein ABH865_01655 [Candidatus Omnitrophota bacterium]